MTAKWPDINPFPARIEDALRRVLNLQGIDPADVTAAAWQIFAASEFGRSDEHTSNRPASRDASEKELRAFHDLCGKLADHIEGMRNPAIAALSQEGLIARDLMRTLQAAQETARCAFGMIEDAPSPRGRPPELEAAEVTQMTAVYYRQFTGRVPTFATDPQSNEVSGAWIDTLRAVFEALGIRASVQSQAKALREKIPAERWH